MWVGLTLLLLLAWWPEQCLVAGPKTSPRLGITIAVFVGLILLGILSTLIGMNPVRAYLPWDLQLASIAPYLDGLLVYYLILRNRWGQAEFEGFAKRLMLVGAIMSVESLLTYYLKLPLGINAFSVYDYEKISGEYNFRFMSVFSRHTIFPGRIGLITAGLSYFFWHRTREKKYLVLLTLAGLMVLSTTSRMVIIGLALGVGIMMLYHLRKIRWTDRNYMLKPLIASVGIFTFLVVAFFTWNFVSKYREGFSDAAIFATGLARRGFQSARGVDVFIQHPLLGAGPGLTRFYAVSGSVRPILSGNIEMDTTVGGAFYAQVSEQVDSEETNPLEVKAHSLHNGWFNFIVDLGLLGLILFGLYVGKGLKMFFVTMRKGPRSPDQGPVLQWMTLLTITFVLTFSTLSTAKFNVYWIFAFFIAFLSWFRRQEPIRKLLP